METLVRKHRMELDKLRKANKRQRAKKQLQAAMPISNAPMSSVPPVHALPGNLEQRPDTPSQPMLNESFNAPQQVNFAQSWAVMEVLFLHFLFSKVFSYFDMSFLDNFLLKQFRASFKVCQG